MRQSESRGGFRQSYGLSHNTTTQEFPSPGGNVRPHARLVLGYYPLPDAEAVRIGRFLQFPSSPANAIDPCAGTGAALAEMTAASRARRYAIELDAHRAGEARKICQEVIQGSAFDCHSPVESFSLL